MNVPGVNDLKDLAILIGFIGTCAVLLWRMKAAEEKIKEHHEVLDQLATLRGAAEQLHEDHARRIGRLEDRVFDGRDR